MESKNVKLKLAAPDNTCASERGNKKTLLL